MTNINILITMQTLLIKTKCLRETSMVECRTFTYTLIMTLILSNIQETARLFQRTQSFSHTNYIYSYILIKNYSNNNVYLIPQNIFIGIIP